MMANSHAVSNRIILSSMINPEGIHAISESGKESILVAILLGKKISEDLVEEEK